MYVGPLSFLFPCPKNDNPCMLGCACVRVNIIVRLNRIRERRMFVTYEKQHQ